MTTLGIGKFNGAVGQSKPASASQRPATQRFGEIKKSETPKTPAKTAKVTFGIVEGPLAALAATFAGVALGKVALIGLAGCAGCGILGLVAVMALRGKFNFIKDGFSSAREFVGSKIIEPVKSFMGRFKKNTLNRTQ